MAAADYSSNLLPEKTAENPATILWALACAGGGCSGQVSGMIHHPQLARTLSAQKARRNADRRCASGKVAPLSKAQGRR